MFVWSILRAFVCTTADRVPIQHKHSAQAVTQSQPYQHVGVAQRHSSGCMTESQRCRSWEGRVERIVLSMVPNVPIQLACFPRCNSDSIPETGDTTGISATTPCPLCQIDFLDDVHTRRRAVGQVSGLCLMIFSVTQDRRVGGQGCGEARNDSLILTPRQSTKTLTALFMGIVIDFLKSQHAV